MAKKQKIDDLRGNEFDDSEARFLNFLHRKCDTCKGKGEISTKEFLIWKRNFEERMNLGMVDEAVAMASSRPKKVSEECPHCLGVGYQLADGGKILIAFLNTHLANYPNAAFTDCVKKEIDSQDAQE